eukprot:2158947-Rhodomonas_salina.2
MVNRAGGWIEKAEQRLEQRKKWDVQAAHDDQALNDASHRTSAAPPGPRFALPDQPDTWQPAAPQASWLLPPVSARFVASKPPSRTMSRRTIPTSSWLASLGTGRGTLAGTNTPRSLSRELRVGAVLGQSQHLPQRPLFRILSRRRGQDHFHLRLSVGLRRSHLGVLSKVAPRWHPRRQFVHLVQSFCAITLPALLLLAVKIPRNPQQLCSEFWSSDCCRSKPRPTLGSPAAVACADFPLDRLCGGVNFVFRLWPTPTFVPHSGTPSHFVLEGATGASNELATGGNLTTKIEQ